MILICFIIFFFLINIFFICNVPSIVFPNRRTDSLYPRVPNSLRVANRLSKLIANRGIDWGGLKRNCQTMWQLRLKWWVYRSTPVLTVQLNWSTLTAQKKSMYYYCTTLFLTQSLPLFYDRLTSSTESLLFFYKPIAAAKLL
jgi:hypothetical protein